MYKRGPNRAFFHGVFCHWLRQMRSGLWWWRHRALEQEVTIFSRGSLPTSTVEATIRIVIHLITVTGRFETYPLVGRRPCPVYTMHNSVPALWKSIRATRRFRADPLGRVFLPFVQLIPIPKCHPNSWLGGSSKHNWAMTDSIAGESFVESESRVKLFRRWNKS